MKHPCPLGPAIRVILLGTLGIVPLTRSSKAAEVPETLPAAHAEPGAIPVLDLAQCLHLAQQQPRLVAARASLAAAEAQLHALENLHAIPVLPGGRELPIRRKQAALGVEIARAELARAEQDVAYNVTRTYFTAVYAKKQKKVTATVTRELGLFHGIVRKGVDTGEARAWTKNDVEYIASYLRLAQSRDVEAAVGIDRALAALQEAMGAEPHGCFQLADDTLPYRPLDLCGDEIVNLALTRRPEVAQADTLISVYQLEVDAQCKICGPTAKTFAAGSDIHARMIPPELHNGEYRPGGLAPEMPVILVGKKCDRKERAQVFADRAAAVADKTRNLIVLEAKDVYLRWLEAARRVPLTEDAAKQAEALVRDTREDFEAPAGGKRFKVSDGVTFEVHAAQARSQYNEALFRYVIGLAGLERVTGGGFCAGFSAPSAPPAK